VSALAFLRLGRGPGFVFPECLLCILPLVPSRFWGFGNRAFLGIDACPFAGDRDRGLSGTLLGDRSIFRSLFCFLPFHCAPFRGFSAFVLPRRPRLAGLSAF